MTGMRMSGIVMQDLPADLEIPLAQDLVALVKREEIPSPGRNGRTGWVEAVTKPEIRGGHIRRA